MEKERDPSFSPRREGRQREKALSLTVFSPIKKKKKERKEPYQQRKSRDSAGEKKKKEDAASSTRVRKNSASFHHFQKKRGDSLQKKRPDSLFSEKGREKNPFLPIGIGSAGGGLGNPASALRDKNTWLEKGGAGTCRLRSTRGKGERGFVLQSLQKGVGSRPTV